jgi:hypothetical protein
MDGHTVPRMDPGLSPGFGTDIERATGPHQHAPDMGTCSRSLRNDRAHHVAGLKAKVRFLAVAMPNRKAVLVGSTHLT